MNTVNALAAVMALLVGGVVQAAVVPPLTQADRARLDTAIDGVEQREEAFAALVEHVRSWPEAATIDLDELPLRRRIDAPAMREAPATMRGELVLLDGTLAQRTDLPRAWSGVTEWFVRDEYGQTIIAFVSGNDASAGVGDRVRVLGRLYKPITMTSRDGLQRSWPAMVGVALEARPMPGMAGNPVVLVLAGAVLLGAAAWVLLRRRVNRDGYGDVAEALAAIRRDADDEDVEGSLPNDPADALASMRARRVDGKEPDA